MKDTTTAQESEASSPSGTGPAASSAGGPSAALKNHLEAAQRAVQNPQAAAMEALQASAAAALSRGSVPPPESIIAVPTAQAAYMRWISLEMRLAAQAAERAALRATYAAILEVEHVQIQVMNSILDGEKEG